MEKARHSHTVALGIDTDLLILLFFPPYIAALASVCFYCTFNVQAQDKNKLRCGVSRGCSMILIVMCVSNYNLTMPLVYLTQPIDLYGLRKTVFLKKDKKSASFDTQAKKIFFCQTLKRKQISI